MKLFILRSLKFHDKSYEFDLVALVLLCPYMFLSNIFVVLMPRKNKSFFQKLIYYLSRRHCSGRPSSSGFKSFPAMLNFRQKSNKNGE